MAELAMSAWGVGLDEFYSTQANIDEVRGFTIPRLKALTGAYTRRRGRELRELAIAWHSPEKLGDLYPSQTHAQQAHEAVPLERKKWW